ncbi:MAG TPA: T9SS type A sorting domain-containing protein [Pontibacter sp.]
MTQHYNGHCTLLTFARARLWLLLFISILCARHVFADAGNHMLPLSLQERLQDADIVVEGEVISKKSFWDQRRENIYTSNIIKVYKVFKGNLQEAELEVITEGGTVGLDKHVYSVALTLSTGEQGMFFLKRQNLQAASGSRAKQSTRPYGSEQGFIRYDTRSQTAKGVFEEYSSIEQVYRAIRQQTGTNYRAIQVNQQLQVTRQQEQQHGTAAAAITGFSPKVASGGNKTVLTITGSGFGSSRGTGTVSFRDADDGGTSFTKAPEDAYLSWTNNEIRLYVPSTGSDGGTAGTGEIRVTASDGTVATTTDKITIPYSYTNLYEKGKSYQPALVNIDRAGGYTIRFGPSMQSRANAQEGFRRAVNSWVCATNVNWKIGAPTTKAKTAADDEITIVFEPESTVGKNVLARTLSRYRGCEIIATGELSWWLSEFDMEINSNIEWQYGPGPPGKTEFDFETVMLHELGHAHQLSHVILPRVAVMHYALENERYYRMLSGADIEGGELVVARSLEPNICRQPLMVLKEDGECNLAPEIVTLQAAYTSGGEVQLNWETSSEAEIVRYVVERSEDGITFEEIGTVSAAAANAFTDPDPLSRIAYYRLRVVYNDGEERYSARVRITNPEFLYVFEVAPNPVGSDNKFTITYLVDRNMPTQLFLYDTSGKIVRSLEVVFTDANLPLEFDLTGVSPGIYILRWASARGNGTTKVVKL